MDKKASLRRKLAARAMEHPLERPTLAPILRKLGMKLPEGFGKVAAKDAEKFTRWAIRTKDPLDPRAVEGIINTTLGVKTKPPKPSGPRGPRFKRGDQVEIKAAKHKQSKFDIGPYKKFDKKVGTVTEVDGVDVLVAFKGESAPVRFEGAMSPRGVGIYKYVPPIKLNGSKQFEMIYLADPSAKRSPEDKVLVDEYIARGTGRGESRTGNYYTGHVFLATTNKAGEFYFRAAPQQRIDLSSEAGFKWRTFNPTKGKVLYIGVVGQRPSNWEKEFEETEKALNGA